MQSHVCPFKDCDKSFTKPSKLHRHLVSHSDERQFRCSFCVKSYKRQEHLNVHLLSHQEDEKDKKPHKCLQCEKRFVSAYHLKRHLKIHDPAQRAFPCAYHDCEASFTKHYQLQQHVRNEHTLDANSSSNKDDMPFKCSHENCDKVYDTQQKLSRHQKSHNITRDYICGYNTCKFICHRWTDLQNHVKVAHPPTCSVCNKTFTKNYGLKNHIKLTGHVQFVDRFSLGIEPTRKLHCFWEGCEKSFKSNKALQVHIKSSHLKIKPFQCIVDGCQASFSHKQMLERHIKTHERQSTPPDTPKSTVKNQKSEDMSVIGLLTGGEFVYAEGLKIPCPIKKCKYRFAREYDCMRHVKSYHSDYQCILEEGDVNDSDEEVYLIEDIDVSMNGALMHGDNSNLLQNWTTC